MPNLGNAWHIPGSPEPRGRGGMRDPIGALVPGAAITIISGNQFKGGGNEGNQLQDGSSVFFKRGTAAAWTELPMAFMREDGNNKYFSATIPANTSSAFRAGESIRYYLRIRYSDHDATFLHAAGDASIPTGDEGEAQGAPFAFTVESSAVRGRWEPVFDLPNVAVHTHVLPNGKVLFWGRRQDPTSTVFSTLNEPYCFPFLWDPATGKSAPAAQPAAEDGQPVNLFCSGHTFLPDGRLLVVGGHLFDGQGSSQASIYGPADAWQALPAMKNGRWYPTAVTLPDGTVLASSGGYPTGPLQPPPNQSAVNNISELWAGAGWTAIADFNQDGRGSLQLYPRLHVAPDGRVFMSGGLAQSFFLDPRDGAWAPGPQRQARAREYAPAVLYGAGKVLFIGGGLDTDTLAPSSIVEKIDLAGQPLRWERTTPMTFARRQHNAVLLPDGSVLVVGGTRGSGFNNLDPGQPVHAAERWDPATESWTLMAAEEVDRCYHSTAVLLPDARVFSAGGGEYAPAPNVANDPADSHADAQIFSPPYLFKPDGTLAERPDLTAPDSLAVTYGQTFEVGTSKPDQIDEVSWIRLPSVTHAFDQSQRINFLSFAAGDGVLRVTAPADAGACPPGPYMLFVLNREKVPSVAKIVRIGPAPAPPAPARPASVPVGAPTALAQPTVLAPPRAASLRRLALTFLTPQEKAARIAGSAEFAPVTVGVTAMCPYGLSACWGGAHDALERLQGVTAVSPIADSVHSTATVYLNHGGLPDLGLWPEEFARTANGSHLFRGVEIALAGEVAILDGSLDGSLIMAGNDARPDVALAPLRAGDKIQWSHESASPWPPTPEEAAAYQELAAALCNAAGPFKATVTGPLQKDEGGFVLRVREFKVETA